MFSLLVGWPGQKESWPASASIRRPPRKSWRGGAKNGTAANIASIYNCLIFSDVFWELSKHTSYTKGSYGAFLTCGKEEKINYE
jgi:hypothetical protein